IDWTLTQADKEWQFMLNKMNWFKNYIGTYQKTKDEKYVHAWMNQIESWIDFGDPGYPRTIDTGRRLDNWVISYWMFVHELKSPSVTPEFHSKMLFSMMEQAEFAYEPDHWRRHSNWGSFENHGLSKFVILFPEFKRNEMWLREIFFRMRYQLSESYYPDGMHIEVSPSYHSHELGVWFEFFRMADANGVTNPWHSQIPLPLLDGLLLRPAEVLMYWYKPTGVVPQVGDTDEGGESAFLYKMGTFWNRQDFIYVATNGKKGNPPEKTSINFPNGGYSIMRSGWGNKTLPFNEELYLLFDCGTNYPWHAHYDVLNIVATAYGHDLLKDPGRFTYNDGPEREVFKSSAAHNTIVIDGRDQPQHYTPPSAQWHSLHGFDYVIGTQASHPQVTHQRSVFFAKPKYWIIVDRLTGTEHHRYDQYWHLSEETKGKINIESEGRQITIPHCRFYSILPEADLTVEQGWLSYKYRRKIEAPVLLFSVKCEPPVIWTTLLYPYKSEPPELTVERLELENYNDSSGYTGLIISSDKETHYFLEQETAGSVCQTGFIKTDAKIVFIRINDLQQPVQYHFVEGSFLKFRDDELIRIFGTKSDVSVQKERIEINGDWVSGFQLQINVTPEVILNGDKIDVHRDSNLIKYFLRTGSINKQ
ncbi:MAG: alginate lyase family protein, partial [bacterium]